MKRTKVSMLGAVAVSVACCADPVAPEPDLSPIPEEVLAFVNVHVIPMDSDRILDDQTVIVEDGRIAALGPAEGVQVPAGARRIEGSGRYLIPGLADMHTHASYPADLLQYLAYGVTTVLDMGHSDETPILEWRDRIRGGQMLGPTIYSCGRVIDGKPRESSHFEIVSTADAARTAVQRQAAQGVDFIKAYNDLSLEAFDAVVLEARRYNIAVVGHGVRAPGLVHSLEFGQVMVAHAEEVLYTFFNSQLDESRIPAAVDLFVDNHTTLTPNLSAYSAAAAQWGNTPAFEEMLQSPAARLMDSRWEQRWRDKHQRLYANRSGSLGPSLEFLEELTKAMSDGGVPLILGTDSPEIPGMAPGASLLLDLETLVDAGLSPYEALVAGTRTAGSFVRKYVLGAEQFGTIEVGSRADLLLLDANPLDDIRSISRQEGIVVRGGWITHDELIGRLKALKAGN